MADTQKPIPVAECKYCEIATPCYIVPGSLVEGDTELMLLICGICFNLLNYADNDILVTYYDQDGLEALGWEIQDA